jgi:hypothetical protein
MPLLDNRATEDFVLTHAKEFVEMRQRAHRDHAAGESVDLDDIA